MKNIDFLPPEMLRQQEVRTLRWWWIAVCLAFGFFICTAATLQFFRMREVKSELVRIQPLCDAAKSHEQLIADLKAKLQQEYDVADLYAFLDHPWPRSRILAELIIPLPTELKLTEIKLSEQQRARSDRRAAAPTQVLVNAADKPQLPPAIADFDSLWKRSSELRTVIEITGLTRDAFQLHKYVGELTSGELVESAKLEALEEVADENQREMRFTLRVVIRPAYSLPGGPTAKDDNVPTTAAVPGGAT